jgi:glycosyltransferase involved in cell wall biosynthesis
VLKKLLIVSTFAPPAISGAPLMAYNVLRYFPENSFAILTSHVGLTDQIIENGPRLNAKYFFFDSPSVVARPMKEKRFFLKAKRFVSRIHWLRAVFHFLSLFYLPFNIVTRGRKIIQDEKIEQLFAYSDYGPALISVYLLHKLTGKPFSLHFYDLYYGNNLLWFFSAIARYLEPKLFKTATHISVMSESLAAHYQSKYCREVAVVRNAIPIDCSNRPELSESDGRPYKIIYTGTIVWAQDSAIRNLVKAVNAISDYKVVLYLYTPHDDAFLESQGLFKSKNVIFARGLPREMPAIQRSADILFVGLSFETPYPLLISTSSPGKTCEYMISGTPILVHAPQNSHISKYARQYGFACVVDQNDVESLRQGIERLISNREYAEQLVSNAWNTALANHDAERVSANFQEYLQA